MFDIVCVVEPREAGSGDAELIAGLVQLVLLVSTSQLSQEAMEVSSHSFSPLLSLHLLCFFILSHSVHFSSIP